MFACAITLPKPSSRDLVVFLRDNKIVCKNVVYYINKELVFLQFKIIIYMIFHNEIELFGFLPWWSNS